MSTAVRAEPAEGRLHGSSVYPFSAIVGQERMKLALVLNSIEPRIGGVLIRGEKGTAKSTAVRGLAALLPHHCVREGCAFACDPGHPEEWCPDCLEDKGKKTGVKIRSRRVPLVTLPLNATEDMVSGGLDFSASIRGGRCVFQPGLLARVHRGILYIDEVNLLDDHLVDVILDAAASGENLVEREGMTFRHASRFALVGTMNPEEGSLRPQLLDRFGLCVDVTSERDAALRVELIERRERFELDPEEVRRRFAGEEAERAAGLLQARNLLPSVRLIPSVRRYIGELARSRNVAGHRADLVIERSARALSAWNGRTETSIDDVLEVAEMALNHRSRDAVPTPPPPRPQPPGADNAEPKENSTGESDPEQRPAEPPREDDRAAAPPVEDLQEGSGAPEAPSPGESPDRRFDTGAAFSVRKLEPPDDRLVRRGSGRRSRTHTNQRQGRYVRSRMGGDGRDPALDATLRAAAPHQLKRRRGDPGSNAVVIRHEDWREKVREKRVGCFILFVVDASGSMGARGRMAASKGAILSLLLDAYQKRDRVAMIAFRRRGAETILPPTASIELAARLLADLPVGGRTPLSAGLTEAYRLLHRRLIRDPNLRPLGIIITDGKSNVSLGAGSPTTETLQLATRVGEDRRIHWIVVDTEEPGIVRFELANRLASALRGDYFRIDGLRASDLVKVVSGFIHRQHA